MATKVELNCEMTCSKCEDKVRKALDSVVGVKIQSINIPGQQVLIEVSERATVTIPDLQNLIEETTGLRTVVKGIGEGIATVSEFNGPGDLIGVIRLAQMANNRCLVDGIIDHVKLNPESNHCRLDIHEFGDLRGETFDHVGPVKVPILKNVKPIASRCLFRGNVDNCDLTSVIGRSLVIKEQESDRKLSAAVVARVSPIYGNEKKVCLCSGVLTFTDVDCNYRLINPDKSKVSPFDCLLETKWRQAQTINNLFLFQFNPLEKLILPGKYGFVVSRNTGRVNRRLPQPFNSIGTPFDESKFNFNRVKPQELLFQVSKNNLTKPIASIIINNSPIEYCSSLMVIDPTDCLPQWCNKLSLQMAINLISISDSINLRMGFNTLGAAASVNHCHWHLYYQSEQLYIQSVQTVKGHFFSDWPLPGFLFEIIDNQSIDYAIDSIMTLVNYVHSNHPEDHSYNLFITRSSVDLNSTIRVFIWIRKVIFGSKNLLDFNPGLCELAGFFNCKSDEMLKKIDQQFCINLLKSIEIDNINEYIELLDKNY